MERRKPDVVFFMVDQLSAKWLEAAWEGVCPTPNVDRLRARGTVFRNAITSNPVCCPTRATIATGLTTRQHGVLENGYSLNPELPTFMRALQRGGWRTGAFGKVHFHPHFAGLWPDYRPYGFDVARITEDPRGGEWLDWVREAHPEHFDVALATIWPSRIPDFAKYGPDGENMRERIEKVRGDFDWKTLEFPENTGGAYTLPFPKEVSQTEWITRHALDFIGGAADDDALFVHVSYVQPHSPFCPPADYMDRVDMDRLPEPAPAEWAVDPHAPRYFQERRPCSTEAWRHERRCYFADLVHLDEQLGRVLDALEETGRLDNAFVFFVSDHGELLMDHGFKGKEERHYDACIRVPLIVAGAGLAKGQVRDEFVQLEDICPTILDMTGQSLPPMPKMGPYLDKEPEDIPIFSGRSLAPLLRGETIDDWRSSAYTESYNHIAFNNPTFWPRTIRTKEFRYTFYGARGGEQLFDLRADPDEQKNVVADPAYTETRQRLRDELVEMIVLQDYPNTRRDLFALGVH